MSRRVLIVGSLMVMSSGFVTCALWSISEVAAQSPPARAAQKANDRSTRSEQSGDELTRIEKKLDQVLANQETIMKRFDAVMEELRIVKVRATLRGGTSP